MMGTKIAASLRYLATSRWRIWSRKSTSTGA